MSVQVMNYNRVTVDVVHSDDVMLCTLGQMTSRTLTALTADVRCDRLVAECGGRVDGTASDDVACQATSEGDLR